MLVPAVFLFLLIIEKIINFLGPQCHGIIPDNILLSFFLLINAGIHLLLGLKD